MEHATANDKRRKKSGQQPHKRSPQGPPANQLDRGRPAQRRGEEPAVDVDDGSAQPEQPACRPPAARPPPPSSPRSPCGPPHAPPDGSPVPPNAAGGRASPHKEAADAPALSLLDAPPATHAHKSPAWDLQVVCGPFAWCVHKHVMRRCRYFSSFLPVYGLDDPSPRVLALHRHCPGQLASVIHFMYYFHYPGADYDPQEPLYGDSLLTNTAMYVAGASVGHHGMMAFALRKIDAWVKAVSAARPAEGVASGGGSSGSGGGGDSGDAPLHQAARWPGTMEYALLRLAAPLRRALAIVYEQPLPVRAGPLFDLRVVLVRFVAVALPLLAVSGAFRAQFRNEWDCPLPAPPPPAAPPGTPAARPPSLVDCLVVDYAMFFDLCLVGWESGREAAAARHTRKPEQPTVARTLALLQRLARIERAWVDKAEEAGGGDDGAAAANDDREAQWQASLSDHEKALGEIMQGAERVLSRSTYEQGAQVRRATQ